MLNNLLYSTAKVFERSHPKTPLVGRTANVKPLALNSSRKALGNVNRPLTATKKQIPKGKKAASAKKVGEPIFSCINGSTWHLLSLWSIGLKGIIGLLTIV